MTASSPIGVFDSGVGGLSVLRHIRQLLPAEQLIYVADSRHAPYGPKSNVEVLTRCRQVMHFFQGKGVKAVVVACNTATAAAVIDLRAEFSLPIVAMEPGVKPAAEQSRSAVIGVLATEGTIESDRFISLKSRFADKVEIITVACHGLVDNIEQDQPDLPARRQMLESYIRPVLDKGADMLILGCTHYHLIRDEIAAVAGPDVQLMDTGPAVARELKRRLADAQLLNTGADGERPAAEPLFFTSGEVEQQTRVLGRFWPGLKEVKGF